MNGVDLLERTWWTALEERADASPDAVAFQIAGPTWARSLTFAQWHRLSRRASASLAVNGVGPGDLVAVLAPGSAVWPILQLACSRLGAILVPINTRYREDELTYVLSWTQPKAVFYIEHIRDESILTRMRTALDAVATSPLLVSLDSPDVTTDLSPAADWTSLGSTERRVNWDEFLAASAADPKDVTVAPDAPVLMQFTSGTTSFPKGALLSSASTLRATFELGQRMGLTDADVMYSTQPMYHVGGSVATTLMALTIGCTMVVPERYSPEETFRLVKQYGVTARTGQAAMYAMELAHPLFDPKIFGKVTKGWSGGSAELKRVVVEQMGITGLVSNYGLTEAAASTTVCSYDDPLELRLTSCGRPLPDVEVGILADGALQTTATDLGEICVRGWPLMVGYFDDPEATAEVVDEGGWLHTGDLGRIDAQGYLFFVDRIKEMIKPGGENVSPAEVERVILTMAGVNQVAVVGTPHERLGEVPVAFVERAPDSDLSEEQVVTECERRMARFKVPNSVIFVDTWPMTESGKILKRDLAASLEAGPRGWVGQSG